MCEHMVVELKQAGPLFVRIPPWIEEAEIDVTGLDRTPIAGDDYLFIAEPPVGECIAIKFPLKEQDLVLSERLHIQPIRVRLRGDAVMAMDNFGADLTFFDAYA